MSESARDHIATVVDMRQRAEPTSEAEEDAYMSRLDALWAEMSEADRKEVDLMPFDVITKPQPEVPRDVTLRVVRCDTAIADDGTAHDCPFNDLECIQCRHPGSVGLEPGYPHEGRSLMFAGCPPEWCPLRKGTVTVRFGEEGEDE